MELQHLKPGQELTTRRYNALVDAINHLMNVQGGGGIKITKTPNGTLIANTPDILCIDDKYAIDQEFNDSDMIKRRADGKRGDIGDFIRVRAYPYGEPRANGERRDLPAYRAMLLIDAVEDNDRGEGGFVTDSGGTGRSLTKYDATDAIPPPIRRVGRISNVLILTDDDGYLRTPDGDLYTYLNVRHDAHFMRGVGEDGRIYFITETPGQEFQLKVKGAMIPDPTLANTDTALGRESCEWRPQIKIPFPFYTPPIFPPYDPDPGPPTNPIGPDNFPPFGPWVGPLGPGEYVPKPISQHPDDDLYGFAADVNVGDIIQDYNFGLMLEYMAENTSGVDKQVVFKCIYRVVNNGEDWDVGGLSGSEKFILPIPNGSVLEERRDVYCSLIDGSTMLCGDTVVIRAFYRDPTDVDDTFVGTVGLAAFKTCWTTDDPGDEYIP